MILDFPMTTRNFKLTERNDIVRVEDGTLIVNCDQHYECGSNEMVTLRVTMEDEIILERLLNGARSNVGEAVDPDLAYHIRKAAMPLIISPKDGLAAGVDFMLAAAERHSALNPALMIH